MPAQKNNTLLVLASTFPRWKNDNEPRFIYDLCLRLKDNYNVILLTSHFENTKNVEDLDGLKVFRYRYAPIKLEKLVYDGGITTNLKKSPWKWLLVPSFLIAQFFAVRKLLQQYPITLIHAHWLIPQGFVGMLALKSLRKSNLPILCTSHGGDLFGLQNKMSLKIKKWVIQKSNTLTVVSKAMLSPIQELVPEAINKTHVIPMGTDFTNLFTANSKIPRKTNMLLFSGRLVEKKGVDTLIKAMPEVLKEFSNTQLIIAGDGPEKINLQKIVTMMNLKASINFIGKQSHDELSKLYSRATISVFPFQKAQNGDIEGLGLVMLEALGCGCPVIAGNVPAVHDVIQHNVTGIITEQKNVNNLAKNIITLLSSTEKRQRLAENGRKHAIKYFSWDITGKKFVDIIESLI